MPDILGIPKYFITILYRLNFPNTTWHHFVSNLVGVSNSSYMFIVLTILLTVYLEDQYLGIPKILSKYKSIILLHITTDVLIYLNDIMICVTQTDCYHTLFRLIPCMEYISITMIKKISKYMK